MIDRICYDMKRNDLCPLDQDLVKTSDGFSCIYRQKKSPVHGTKLTSCSTGQVLSQAMRMFYCETHTVPPLEVLKCHVGEVFVKIGGGYACITEYEASLKCTGKHYNMLNVTLHQLLSYSNAFDFLLNERLLTYEKRIKHVKYILKLERKICYCVK